MASLEEAFTTQINTSASARNPNAYLATQQQQQQQQQNWGQQQQQQQNWGQQQEWLTPKQSPNQAINDAVTPQQAAAQIAHQHRFVANELRLASDDSADTHWWFIRPRTGLEYCYPKKYNYKADD
jgi:hypothetical protein